MTPRNSSPQRGKPSSSSPPTPSTEETQLLFHHGENKDCGYCKDFREQFATLRTSLTEAEAERDEANRLLDIARQGRQEARDAETLMESYRDELRSQLRSAFCPNCGTIVFPRSELEARAALGDVRGDDGSLPASQEPNGRGHPDSARTGAVE